MKAISFNLKSPQGRDEPGIACLWLEMRLLEIWAFALTFEGSREGTALHIPAGTCWVLFHSIYGQDAKNLPQAISPGGTFLYMSKGHRAFCHLPVKLHPDSS